jgi:WD40 repeat protein
MSTKSEENLICSFHTIFGVKQVAWSPDGLYIASASEGGIVSIWDISRRERHFAVSLDGEARGVTWFLKKNYLLCASSSTGYTVLDINTRNIISSYSSYSSGYAGSGQLIPTSGNRVSFSAIQEAFLMDGFQEVHVSDIPSNLQKYERDCSLKINIYDLKNKYLPQKVKSGIPQFSAFSNDGLQIAVTYNKLVYVLSLRDHSNYLTYSGHTKRVSQIAWVPNSNQIVSLGEDGDVHLWDANTGKKVVSHHLQAHYLDGWHKFALSPDGRYIGLVTEDRAIHVWEISTGKTISVYRGHASAFNRIRSLAWSPDGSCIASGDKKGFVHLWQVA